MTITITRIVDSVFVKQSYNPNEELGFPCSAMIREIIASWKKSFEEDSLFEIQIKFITRDEAALRQSEGE